MFCGNRDFSSYNLYTYASNNPIILSDENGHGLLSSFKKAVKSTFSAAKKVVKSVVSQIGKSVINVVGQFVCVNLVVEKTEGSFNGLLGTGVEVGTTTTYTKTVFGNPSAPIKINTGSSKGIEIGNKDRAVSFNISSDSIDFSYKKSNGDDTKNYDFGLHGLSLYMGTSTTTSIGDGVEETVYSRFNLNMAIPIVIYVGAPYILPIVKGISFAVPSFPAIPAGAAAFGW